MLPLLALLSSRLTVIADETPPTPKLACTVPYWCEPDPQRVLNITHDVKFDDVEGHPLLLDLYDPGAPECGCEGTLSAIMLCCTERAPMCHFNAQRSQCAVNRTASRRRPVIIVIHGGGFHDGDKNESNVVKMSTRLAQRGFLVAAINYRLPLPKEGIFPAAALAAVQDTRAAIRWLVHRAGELALDPQRIASFGESAGAITSNLLPYLRQDPVRGGGDPTNISCAISLSGFLLTAGLRAPSTLAST